MKLRELKKKRMKELREGNGVYEQYEITHMEHVFFLRKAGILLTF